MGWYDITDKLGKICILIAPCFALLGLYQLIRRRSLKRVDADLWALAGLYVALGAARAAAQAGVVARLDAATAGGRTGGQGKGAAGARCCPFLMQNRTLK